jgi:hypothetical protein
MSENRLKPTDLLNNVASQTTSALTGFRPVLGEIVTGGDVRGTDRDRAAEALRDREVERIKAGSGAINLTSSVFGGASWGARAMILVSLLRSNTPISLRELQIGSEGIRMGSVRVGQEAFKRRRAGEGHGHDRKQSSTRMPFNFGKQAT